MKTPGIQFTDRVQIRKLSSYLYLPYYRACAPICRLSQVQVPNITGDFVLRWYDSSSDIVSDLAT
jgi:hypothetical protein